FLWQCRHDCAESLRAACGARYGCAWPQMDVEPGIAVPHQTAARLGSVELGFQVLARCNAGTRALRRAAPARPQPRQPRVFRGTHGTERFRTREERFADALQNTAHAR